MKLTQRRIDDRTCPAGRRDVMVFDDEQRGLGVRVTAGGGKSYVAQYTFAGSKRRVPLGSCSAISLAAAREAVRTILGDAARGVDTAAERKEARLKASADALTLADLIDQWDKLHLSAKRANYSTAATNSLRRSFAHDLDKPAAALNRSAVVRVLDRLSKDDRAAMAAATARYGSALYGWAIRRGTPRESVRARACRPDCPRRERVVSDDEATGFGPELRDRARSTASFEGRHADWPTGAKRSPAWRRTRSPLRPLSLDDSNKSGKERCRARGPAVTAGTCRQSCALCQGLTEGAATIHARPCLSWRTSGCFPVGANRKAAQTGRIG